jgi:hypothetical protein
MDGPITQGILNDLNTTQTAAVLKDGDPRILQGALTLSFQEAALPGSKALTIHSTLRTTTDEL